MKNGNLTQGCVISCLNQPTMKQHVQRARIALLVCSSALAITLTSGGLKAQTTGQNSADAAAVAVEGMGQSAPESSLSLPNFLKVGPFELRPYFAGSMLYDDNIRIQSHQPVHDVVWTLSPGITIGGGQYEDAAGTFLTLDYRPDIVLYTDHDEFNSVDHWVNFRGQRHWEKLTLGIGQAFQSGTGGYTEALNRVERSVYVTTARAIYEYSDKTSFEVDGLQNISDYDNSESQRLISYNQWELQTWGNYQATPKINVGLGGAFGWRDVQLADNQTYQQALVRGIYTLTAKTRLNASLGMQFEQYQGGGSRGPQLVFEVGGAYKPWVRTTFTLDAYRRTQNSVVQAGQNYTLTGVRAAVRQQIRDRIFVTLSGGYEQSDYYATTSSHPPDRRDDYFFVGPALDYSITERWFLGAFYRYRNNDSTHNPNDFSNNQVGIRTLFRY